MRYKLDKLKRCDLINDDKSKTANNDQAQTKKAEGRKQDEWTPRTQWSWNIYVYIYNYDWPWLTMMMNYDDGLLWSWLSLLILMMVNMMIMMIVDNDDDDDDKAKEDNYDEDDPHTSSSRTKAGAWGHGGRRFGRCCILYNTLMRRINES